MRGVQLTPAGSQRMTEAIKSNASLHAFNQPFHTHPLPPSSLNTSIRLSPLSALSFFSPPPLRRPQPTNRAAPVLLGTQRSVFTRHYASLLNKRKRCHIFRPPRGSINKEGLGSLAVYLLSHPLRKDILGSYCSDVCIVINPASHSLTDG